MTMTLPILKPTPQRTIEPATKTDSSVFVIDENLAVWRCDHETGELDQVALPEGVEPVDICVGPGGLLLVLSDAEDGSEIHKATDRLATGWNRLEVAARLRRIASGPDGRIWAVDEARGVLVRRAEDGTLERRAEDDFADEISVGGDGRVWVISTEERYSGRVIKWLDGVGGGDWVSMPAPSAAVKLAASPEGVAWSVNSMGAIWRLHPLGSGNFSECQVDIDCDKCLFGGRRDFAKDIAVDGSGTVWFLGVKYTDGGYQLMRLADQGTRHFQKLPDVGGVKLAAG
jgi:streptogramin lyase